MPGSLEFVQHTTTVRQPTSRGLSDHAHAINSDISYSKNTTHQGAEGTSTICHRPP